MPPHATSRHADSEDLHVSRETRERLEILVSELIRWQKAINLVAPSTVTEVWTRHVADSLQLHSLTAGSVWADLGAGGGFPGLVIAAINPPATVHLLEADGRKCAFLRQTAARMGMRVSVWEGRVEQTIAKVSPVPDVVTSRAMAPLADLLRHSAIWLAAGAVGIFPKGKHVGAELTVARESWRFAYDLVPSKTDPASHIVRVTRFEGPV